MIHFIKGLSLLSIGVGVFLLTQAMLPILSYQMWEMTHLANSAPLVAPTSKGGSGFLASQVLGVSVAEANNELVSNLPHFQRATAATYSTFNLTVPKLHINHALVKVDNENPDKNLSLYPGTALPGEKGNVFIMGHSSYYPLAGEPTSYYLSIFKDLNKLEPGDQIVVEVQGQKYTYRVIGLKVIPPTDTSVLNPPDDVGRYISLMTCVPPGTFMKRLIVLGQLE
jgi:sortase A